MARLQAQAAGLVSSRPQAPGAPEPVAIAGAGSIGVAWAIVFARAGHPVALYDPDPARIAASAEEAMQRLALLDEYGLIDEDPSVIIGRISPTTKLEAAVAGAVHVQENAPESIEIKRALFEELDRVADPSATLASSSSTFGVSTFAGALPGRGRTIVAHPGNPPYLLPVVELVPAAFTSEETVTATERLMTAAGMSPVHVRNEPAGFVFNRLQGAVLREAYCLVRDGVCDVDDVDRVMRDGVGRRWAFIGPFETVDLNMRGGIAAHARRLGPRYAEMGRERGQDDPWTDELVADVEAQRRALLPLADWEDRVQWRDQRLMAFERTRRALDQK
jgi:L-gulonate 3-dehydrogenase